MKLIDSKTSQCKDCNEFYKLTSNLTRSSEQGDYFGRFTQLFLKTSPSFKLIFLENSEKI